MSPTPANTRPIYLDHNATTPVAAQVVEAMLPYLHGGFGNTSSGHAWGRSAREAAEAARAQVAALLGCGADEILFTSGGTESNNFALKGAAFAPGRTRAEIVISAVEHPSVSKTAAWLGRLGLRVRELPVDATGRVAAPDLARVLSGTTLLVSVMHSNNEVGTLQPIAELATIAHGAGALLHSDAAQSAGKVPLDVRELGVDLLTIAGHKLYGPKGVGALYVRAGVELEPLLHGAGHERGLRAGTVAVAQVVGLGRACEIARARLAADAPRFRALCERLHRGLVRELGDDRVRRNGHPEQRLPNTLSVAFRDVDANALLDRLGAEVAASPGAACHSGTVEMSGVLRAMGVPPEWAMGTVRFSVGRSTSEAQIDDAVALVAAAVRG